MLISGVYSTSNSMNRGSISNSTNSTVPIVPQFLAVAVNMKFNSALLNPKFMLVAANTPNNDPEAADHSAETKEIRESSKRPISTDSDSAGVDEKAQVGVQKIEATTSAWSRNQLILAYFLCV